MTAYLALSVVFPAVDRILAGSKTLEVRQWSPDLASLPLCNLLLVQNYRRLSSAHLPEDPDGRAMAVVDVTRVRPWLPEDCAQSCSRPEAWEPGWLAWELGNVRPAHCARPVPARLRLYSLEFAEGELRAGMDVV
ncbi:ASCH domain-containing protein [Verrucomicrobia bacterium LW23]|nr:ASCH domain-containing protein [Verrucomicrobia bacterium LW23]